MFVYHIQDIENFLEFMWTSGYLNCLKFNSQKFPRVPPFLGSLYSWEFLGIPSPHETEVFLSQKFPVILSF